MLRVFKLFRIPAVCLLLAMALLAGAGLSLPAEATEPTEMCAELPPVTLTVETPPPETSAAAMALLDTTSGAFLALKNPDERRPMASTTKIMTALVVLSHCNLDTTVTVPPAAVGIEGSSIYLFAGERITVRTLLYALMLSSANDAAHALALHTAGSIEAFAALMNQKAAELGLVNTQFENPHGLPADGHYTTARELALLTAHALGVPAFREIVSTPRYTAPQEGTGATRLFLNHNKLLRTYEGAIGVKTGFTRAAGRCLVSAAERDGLCLVAVTLQDGNDWRDAAALFDWGFANFTVFRGELTAVEMPVVGGSAQTVTLVPARELAVTLPRTHGEITREVIAPHFLYGGCEAGEAVGSVIYMLDGHMLADIDLVAAETVTPNRQTRSLWERVIGFFRRRTPIEPR